MKKIVTLVLEVESDRESDLDNKWIEHDLMQEISCASNTYELKDIKIDTCPEEELGRNIDVERYKIMEDQGSFMQCRGYNLTVKEALEIVTKLRNQCPQFDYYVFTNDGDSTYL